MEGTNCEEETKTAFEEVYDNAVSGTKAGATKSLDAMYETKDMSGQETNEMGSDIMEEDSDNGYVQESDNGEVSSNWMFSKSVSVDSDEKASVSEVRGITNDVVDFVSTEYGVKINGIEYLDLASDKGGAYNPSDKKLYLNKNKPKYLKNYQISYKIQKVMEIR